MNRYYSEVACADTSVPCVSPQNLDHHAVSAHLMRLLSDFGSLGRDSEAATFLSLTKVSWRSE